ncbi:hypothetical protein SESBI_15084 [Sesbania bispinosa]|nr:hypothetical protein SESBI_15084 [Sesbania bispinosa]
MPEVKWTSNHSLLWKGIARVWHHTCNELMWSPGDGLDTSNLLCIHNLAQFLPKDILLQLSATQAPREGLHVDILSWFASPNGEFSLKSAYGMLMAPVTQSFG